MARPLVLAWSLFAVSLFGCSLQRAPIVPGSDASIDAPSLDTGDVGDAPRDAAMPDVPGLDAPVDGGLDAPIDGGLDAPIDGGVDAPIDPCSLCTASEMCCDGVCIDTTSDPLHCGSCDACPATPNAMATCVDSACVPVCDSGFEECDGDESNGCEADLGSLATCTACDIACVDYANTAESCDSTGCVFTCSGAFQSCSSTSPDCETDTATDEASCGACGRTCGPDQTCTGGLCRGWRPLSTTGAPGARVDHVALWTGTEMIIWGGRTNSDDALGDGALYDPATNTWRPMSTTGAPTERRAALAVWTGTQMILWSGYSDATGWANDGALYDPATNTWSPLPATDPPIGRTRSPAAWTGTDMIFWSGWSGATMLAATGATWSPGDAAWDLLPNPGVVARRFHGGVWTGARFVLWGGEGAGGAKLNTGSRYDPGADGWMPTTTTGAPTGRYSHAMVWVDGASRVVVWGGLANDGGFGDSGRDTGARYDPVGDAWTATADGPLAARFEMAAVGTTDEMIVFGGRANDDGAAPVFGDGARYDPASDTWTALPTAGAPSARYLPTAVWTGTSFIVFGGLNDADSVVAGGAMLTL
jgi:N-acetylneuraminic acid mutarotase